MLNKLNCKNFKALMQQILELDIDTEKRLKGSVNLIFEKALDEPDFSEAYANMCHSMTMVSNWLVMLNRDKIEEELQSLQSCTT